MDLNEALIEAAKNGDMSALIDVLEKGADIGAMDENGWTALMWALKNGQIEIANFLNEKWAEKNKIPEETFIFPIEHFGKWGYIDKTEKIVIQPQFDGAGVFSEGLARVRSGGKFGYIDKTGNLVIDSQFDNAYDFYEGLALVKLCGAYGYIDKTGLLVFIA